MDGRRANELRRHTAKLGPLSQADGSAFLQHGHTKALAAVYGPREVGELVGEGEHVPSPPPPRMNRVYAYANHESFTYPILPCLHGAL